MTKSAYQDLEAKFRQFSDIEGALAILNWDGATMMPDGGAVVRGRQLATLSVLAHETLIDPAVGDLLTEAKTQSLDDWQSANLGEMARAHLAATAIPSDLVGKIEETKAATEMAWRSAREADNFAGVADNLQTLLDLVKQSATCLAEAKSMNLYDALLDQYDPGLSYAQVEPLFDDLGSYLPPLIEKIIEAQKAGPPPLVPTPPFAVASQEAFGRKLMADLGFDFNCGRLDTSHHPFSGGVPDDCRITTRYDENDFATGLMGIIHETGHALYEQGLPAKWRDQPVGRSRGMTIHESQSLIMEMQLGRSEGFISWAAPLLAEAYGGTGAAWSAENLTRAYLRVAPGPIRVDADEATYPLHVILRTKLERAMISGDLAIKDLPAAWNDGMKESLGLTLDGDRDGCLQDIHWYMGAFGYFPTYTLGALTAAQLKARIADVAPDALTSAGQGKFAPLVTWLRQNIHAHGCRYGTAELIERATGAPLATSCFKSHLETRYMGGTE